MRQEPHPFSSYMSESAVLCTRWFAAHGETSHSASIQHLAPRVVAVLLYWSALMEVDLPRLPTLISAAGIAKFIHATSPLGAISQSFREEHEALVTLLDEDEQKQSLLELVVLEVIQTQAP
jgi:hypothetical protein